MLLKQTPRHVEKALCSLSGPYEESSAIISPHTSEAGCLRVNSMKKKRELAEKMPGVMCCSNAGRSVVLVLSYTI